MKKFGMFLMMLTLVGYTVGCSKEEKKPETPADPPAADTGEGDAAPAE
ncbi:hypothetical protein [Aeoliella sp.]